MLGPVVGIDLSAFVVAANICSNKVNVLFAVSIRRRSYFGETHILPLVQQFRRGHPELIVDLRLSDRYTNIADAGIDLTIRMGELEDFKINITPIISNRASGLPNGLAVVDGRLNEIPVVRAMRRRLAIDAVCARTGEGA